jgi:hypothetical protein
VIELLFTEITFPSVTFQLYEWPVTNGEEYVTTCPAQMPEGPLMTGTGIGITETAKLTVESQPKLFDS